VSGENNARYCGSFKLFRPDGSSMRSADCPMAQVLKGKIREARDQEVIIERPDASRVTCVVNIRPLKNQRGEVTGAINCFYDITERKTAEVAQRRLEVLAASNQKLEAEIARRKVVEESLKQSEQQQTQLLEASRSMQEQLRHLSRQVLQAQEDERKRISRELHDVIAQTLTGINIRLATLKKGAGLNPKNFDRDIELTQKLVENSVNIVHQFARELRPAVLDDLGLVPALHAFMKNFTAETGVHAHLTAFAGLEELDTPRRTILYRVAQEALTNVSRHAKASRVEVTIQKLAAGICMKINDDGKSFSVDRLVNAKGGKRLGLLGMRERLEMVGGRFEIESAPGRGTTVTAEMPFGKDGKFTDAVPGNQT
jgi:signal transduction histidine kinase